MLHMFLPIILLYFIFTSTHDSGKTLTRGKAPHEDRLNTQKKWEGKLYQLAERKGGRITLSDVIVETGLNIADSEELMDGIIDGHRVKIEFDDTTGNIYYEFTELLFQNRN